MAQSLTHGLIGLKPNRAVRTLYVSQVGITLFTAAALVFCALAIGIGQGGSSIAALLAVVGIPLQLMAAGAAVWAFFKYADIILLSDGLDISGRFVPYVDVKSIRMLGRKRMEVEYHYHGATLRTFIGVPNLIGTLDVPNLARQLQHACDLPTADVSLPTAVPTS
ncbi:MAG: hypothetical protein KDB90_00715 [Planctomycetes bacterium]|nr:hypothetical protein [Planctomycetota bacterium]